MQPVHGGALARPFQTHHNALDVDLSLRIAPELYLKRLIVGGLDRVFEINRNFRNEGISSQHNPEFTMLEFYQAYADYRDLMKLSEELLRNAAAAVHDGKTAVEFDGYTIDFGSLHCVSMKEAIVEFWPDAATRPVMDDLADKQRVAEMIEVLNRSAEAPIAVSSDDSVGQALLAVFEHACEPQLIQPTLVYDYPVEASPLSKNKPDDPAWVERFEIYAAGMEIANAYSELNDPARTAPPLPGSGPKAGRRCRSARHGRGLCPRALLRHATHRGRRNRHRPADDDPHRLALDSRRDLVPAVASGGGDRHQPAAGVS